jgi:hypothetical protein
MTPNPSSTITASTNSTQATALPHLKKAKDTSNVSSSNKKREAIKAAQITGMTDRNSAINQSAEANSPNSRGSEGSDESSSYEENPSFSRHQTTKNKDKKKRKDRALSNESSSGARSFGKTSTGELHMNHKKQKLQDDESVEEDGEHDPTTPEGQMAMNPKLTEKAATTEEKREYNRRNAARARKRNKNMVGDLQEKVHSLTKRTEDLQRSNDVLQAQLEVLRTQNRDLLAIRPDTAPTAQAQTSNDAMSRLLEQLQGNGEAQQKQYQPKQQGQDITQLLNTLAGQGSSSQLRSTLQGGQQAGRDLTPSIQGPGNSQLLSALLRQSQAQQQIPRQQQSISLHTGVQGQSISQLPSPFGPQGQQQQQQASGVTQDQQQIQQLLSSMPPEALYSMLRELSPTGNKDSTGRRR